jgi:hypothetical protein
VPAGGGTLVLLRFLVSEKKGELERLGKADELKLRCGRECFRDIRAIERPAEAHVSRALGGPTNACSHDRQACGVARSAFCRSC